MPTVGRDGLRQVAFCMPSRPRERAPGTCAARTTSARVRRHPLVDDVERLGEARQSPVQRVQRAAFDLIAFAHAAPKDSRFARSATRLATGPPTCSALTDEEKRAALAAHRRRAASPTPRKVASYLLTHARRDMPSLIRRSMPSTVFARNGRPSPCAAETALTRSDMKRALFDLDDTCTPATAMHWAQYHIARGRDRRDDYERRNGGERLLPALPGAARHPEYLPSSSPPSPAPARADRRVAPAISWRRRSVHHPRESRPSTPRTPARTGDRHGASRFSRRPSPANWGWSTASPRSGGSPEGASPASPRQPSFREARSPGRTNGSPRRPASRGFLRDLVLLRLPQRLPLLELVSMPVAVDPDPTLESHARERGWPILRLRA